MSAIINEIAEQVEQEAEQQQEQVEQEAEQQQEQVEPAHDISDEMKTYSVSAESKNSTYTNEYYSNSICGKKVVLIITTMWRWGEFNISIYEKDKESILQMNPLIINDHCGEFISTENGWQDDVEIQNFDSYSDEEKLAIYGSVFEDIENKVVHDSCILEDDNGWELDDTIYEIYCGFELEEE
jgi:hypothetical protein